MRCPFGCREERGKQCSTRRSTAYYRTQEGKDKKKVQNDKRRRQGKAPDLEKETDAVEGRLNAEVLDHVRMATSLIEGRRVGLVEIMKMLRRVLRQRRLGMRRRIDYIVGHMNKASP